MLTNGRTISANAKRTHATTADAPYTVHRPKRASTRLGDPRETLAKPLSVEIQASPSFSTHFKKCRVFEVYTSGRRINTGDRVSNWL